MEAILKVPYSYSDPRHDFDASNEIYLDGSIESQRKWEKSKQEFEQKVVANYRKFNPIISRNINKLGRNMAVNDEVKENNNFKRQQTYMTDTKVIVCDMNNRRISIDMLLDYYRTGEMFILDLQLPVYEQNEELEPEMKAWIRETLQINNAPNLTDEERLVGYTKRDFRLEFPNSKSTALLQNTKLVDIVNNHTFAFLVEKIIFVKNNEK